MQTQGSRLLLILLALLWLLPASLWADEALENRVREISHMLRCPTCQGLSVKESEAGLSMNMKARIRELLQEGKSEEEILQFFVERYGEWILRSPKKTGFNLLLWLTPGVLIFSIGGILLWTMKKKQNQQKTVHQAAPLSEEEARLIQEDLARLQRD